MSTIGRRIRSTGWTRPDPDLMHRLAGIPVANVDDVMQRIYAVDSGIHPLTDHALCGPALTVRVPAGDNLFVHAAMDMIAPGDVLVIAGAGGTDRALLGELMLSYLATKDIGGVLVDGMVRDIDYIRGECPFPVYARGTSPNGPYKNGPGEINFPVAFGGTPVSPGDVVLGDADGLVIVPQADLEMIIPHVASIQEKEAAIISEIEIARSYDRPWVAAQMESIGAASV